MISLRGSAPKSLATTCPTAPAGGKARHNSRYVSSEFHRLTVVDSTLRELEELEKPEW
jgi:hypothetical protein